MTAPVYKPRHPQLTAPLLHCCVSSLWEQAERQEITDRVRCEYCDARLILTPSGDWARRT